MMKLNMLLKAVLMAGLFSISGSAMADGVGDFRSTGETPRDGQLICQRVADSARKAGRGLASDPRQVDRSADEIRAHNAQ